MDSIFDDNKVPTLEEIEERYGGKTKTSDSEKSTPERNLKKRSKNDEMYVEKDQIFVNAPKPKK